MASSTMKIHWWMMLGNAAAKSNRAVMARRATMRGSRGEAREETPRRAKHKKALILAEVSMSNGFCNICLPGTKPF